MTKEIIPASRVATKVLNQAVGRNRDRFPQDFMFRLTPDEVAHWSQSVTSSRKHRGATYRPYAFTEQGVAMLSSVLRSERAVKVIIAIMRAFVISGEHMRPACRRWRRRHLGLFRRVVSIQAARGFSARRQKEHARRVRSPESTSR